jgi:ribosomal 30S subunit maturation factor RimM
MDVLTDFPERFKANRQVYVGEQHEPYRIESVRWNDKTLLVKLRVR